MDKISAGLRSRRRQFFYSAKDKSELPTPIKLPIINLQESFKKTADEESEMD